MNQLSQDDQVQSTKYKAQFLWLERAVRLELTNTGFAIRRLSRLATPAVNWNGRRDSNSRVEFGRLACFQLHHFRGYAGRAACAGSGVRTLGAPGRTWTRNLDVRSVALFHLSYRSEMVWSGRTESNCHHEFPGLGCLRYTTPRRCH